MTTAPGALCDSHRLVIILTGLLAMAALASSSSHAGDGPTSLPTPATTPATLPTTQPARAQWSGRDVHGRPCTVPAADRPTILLFIRPGQAQSDDALARVHSALGTHPAMQTVLVISGPQDAAGGNTVVAAVPWAQAALGDPEYALSGRLAVYAWPTTMVVGPGDGRVIGRLPGLSPAYASHLDAYLDFATGRINRDGLDRLLAGPQIIDEDAPHIAQRRMKVALRLLDSGQLDRAAVELDEGLKLQPDSVPLRLALARVLLRQGHPQPALQLLEPLDAPAGTEWPIRMMHIRALIAAERWQQAGALLASAQQLANDRAEYHYLKGLICQHECQWQQAAEAFREAYQTMRPDAGRAATTRR